MVLAITVVALAVVAAVVLKTIVGPGKNAFTSALRGEPDEVKMSKLCGFYVITYHGRSDLYFPWQRVPKKLMDKIKSASSYNPPKSLPR